MYLSNHQAVPHYDNYPYRLTHYNKMTFTTTPDAISIILHHHVSEGHTQLTRSFTFHVYHLYCLYTSPSPFLYLQTLNENFTPTIPLNMSPPPPVIKCNYFLSLPTTSTTHYLLITASSPNFPLSQHRPSAAEG